MTTTIVKDAAGLTAALKAAQSGDVIKLAPGDYAAMTLTGLKYAGTVTVTSLDPGNMAALTGLTARQLQWWDSRRLFAAAIATHRTEAGGFTERR